MAKDKSRNSFSEQHNQRTENYRGDFKNSKNSKNKTQKMVESTRKKLGKNLK